MGWIRPRLWLHVVTHKASTVWQQAPWKVPAWNLRCLLFLPSDSCLIYAVLGRLRLGMAEESPSCFSSLYPLALLVVFFQATVSCLPACITHLKIWPSLHFEPLPVQPPVLATFASALLQKPWLGGPHPSAELWIVPEQLSAPAGDPTK